MRKVSLERYYFVLYDDALTLKMSKMAFNSFCDKTLLMDVRDQFIFFARIPASAEGVPPTRAPFAFVNFVFL